MTGSDELERRRARLLGEFEAAAARAAGFHALQGGSWARRLKRALALNVRYAGYLYRRFFSPEPKARLFWGKRYLWGRPEHSSSLYLFGVLEHEAEIRLTRFLIRSLVPGDVFLDVGANHGFYSLLAAELVETGRVCAFEPVPYVYRCLAKNARAAGIVEAFDLAVSDRSGTLDFDQAPEERHTGGSFREAGSRGPGAPRFKFTTIQVRSTTLDEFCAGARLVPTVVKIDVEGFERSVVEGAKRTLASASPSVILEVWKPPVDNRDHREAARLLEGLGYRPHALTEEGGLRALDAAALETEFSTGETANLVFRKR